MWVGYAEYASAYPAYPVASKQAGTIKVSKATKRHCAGTVQS